MKPPHAPPFGAKPKAAANLNADLGDIVGENYDTNQPKSQAKS